METSLWKARVRKCTHRVRWNSFWFQRLFNEETETRRFDFLGWTTACTNDTTLRFVSARGKFLSKHASGEIPRERNICFLRGNKVANTVANKINVETRGTALSLSLSLSLFSSLSLFLSGLRTRDYSNIYATNRFQGSKSYSLSLFFTVDLYDVINLGPLLTDVQCFSLRQ